MVKRYVINGPHHKIAPPYSPMPEAVIVDAIRTPIGRAAKGSLKDVRTDDLAAVPLRAPSSAIPRSTSARPMT